MVMKIPETAPDMSSISDSAITPSATLVGYARECNENYYHWDDLKYRDFGDCSRIDVWRLTKISRLIFCTYIRISNLEFSYNLIDQHSIRLLHRIDSGFKSGPPGYVGMKPSILTTSSSMEESIASSQIEGASMSVFEAKRMLRSKTVPKGRSEKMIFNNYAAMQFIKEHSAEPLTCELIKKIHEVITDGLIDSNESGSFRSDDSIVVKDVYEDIICHIPVKHELIESLLVGLCEYVNDDSLEVHPIVKGISIHFILAYIHPFTDGNGRVSRALFYWYCLKRGYTAIEYLSLSKAIKNHRKGYDEAYLLSETDSNDITYFIRYNLRMLNESMDDLDSYIERKNAEQRNVFKIVDGCDLSHRQSQILRDMFLNREPVSQYELSAKYQTSVASIRRDLVKMIDMGLIRMSGKDGHRMLYAYDAKDTS